MTHLDEGTLTALRDGEAEEAARDHLHGCSDCQTALREARNRAETIESLLADLDEPLDVEGAKASVRARLDTGPWRHQARRTPWSSGLGRAAAVLLVAAGAASALPGSPVREWITGTSRVRDEGVGASQGLPVQQQSGIAVQVEDRTLRIAIDGATPGSELEVLFTEGETARIAAPAGSGFSFGDGILEARVVSGPVRVELPSGAVLATLDLNGRRYLSRRDGVLDVLGPSSERRDTRIVFTVPDR